MIPRRIHQEVRPRLRLIGPLEQPPPGRAQAFRAGLFTGLVLGALVASLLMLVPR
jgi:hypothetical protein